MGFSSPDMIGLIACGHSMGGVTSADQPNIVPPGNNPSNIVDFDSTTNFDNKVYVSVANPRSCILTKELQRHTVS
jgi:hypothetical protein